MRACCANEGGMDGRGVRTARGDFSITFNASASSYSLDEAGCDVSMRRAAIKRKMGAGWTEFERIAPGPGSRN